MIRNGEDMRPFHILLGFVIVVYGISLVWQIRKGKLQGNQRLLQFAILGLFALSWVANTLGW
jgi:cytochrome bd-type quinol oxidase subunit 1